ncbi:FtsQ-type POTRA domain-containing protein [Agreia sp. COWG]|uniref:FtsQ-type POTRA domain-containing protein n=1 Tax=Agreia sp. COWG TaxID=2773266 RepID=UPI001929676B|nr:FtsQ-type POTRA domain-containing protein [Agreia sp. COWG]
MSRRLRGRPARSRASSGSAIDEAATEPIPVVTAGIVSADADATRPVSDRPSGDASFAPVSPLQPLPEASDPEADSRAEPKPWWLTRRPDPAVQDSAEADKTLARAEKNRRRYERAEARRFTQTARTRRKRLLIGAASTVAVVLLLVLTAYSPLLAVRTITVEGASRVDAGAVSEALGDQLGRPLTLVDFDEVRKTLATFPLIQSYVTEAQPPSTLVVRIVERRPVVVVAANGAFDLVDPAGVVVETSPARPPGYPTIDVQATPINSAGFAAATQVLLALTPEFLAQVDSVSAATPDSVTLALTNGQRVVWGSAEDSALKARILASMISNPAIPNVSEFDVSSPEAPITK